MNVTAFKLIFIRRNLRLPRRYDDSGLNDASSDANIDYSLYR